MTKQATIETDRSGQGTKAIIVDYKEAVKARKKSVVVKVTIKLLIESYNNTCFQHAINHFFFFSRSNDSIKHL